MSSIAWRTSQISTVLAGLLWCVVGIDAAAQIPEPAAPPAAATPVPKETAPLEEKKLDQFAEAFLAIEEIEEAAKAELAETQDAEGQSQIKADAEQRILDAVEGAGLELDEFNQIAELAVGDAALRTKLADKVEKRRRM